MPTKNCWTPEMVELLRQLHQKHLSSGAIGQRMGLTRNAIIGKLHRLKLMNTNPIKKIPRRASVRRTAPSKPVLKIIGIAPVLKPPAAPAPDKRMTLTDLTERNCKWPIGDPGKEGFHFCGADKDRTASYCPYHLQIAYGRRFA